MTYLFLDTETTGLDATRHHVWEIGWAFGDEKVRSEIVMHSLIGADKEALEIGDYWRRVSGYSAHLGVQAEDELLQRATLEEPTLVGANPRFDAAFLKARWGVEPWHYRILDVQAYAMPLMGLSKPPSLFRVAEFLRNDHDIPEPNHTAAGDVKTTRAIFYALRDCYESEA